MHNPTIGILLSKTPNKTVVEYSLRGLYKPLGVSDYQLSKALPKKLKTDLPTVEELEQELNKEAKELQKPLKGKFRNIKKIGGLKKQKSKRANSKGIRKKTFRLKGKKKK